MKTQRQRWAWILLLSGFAFCVQSPVAARAQDDQQDQQGQQQDQQDDQDPPGRVARLNFAQGSVSFQPAGEGDWVTAVLNRPMVTGDNLWADEDSRAEVHIGSAALRLGAQTGITFLDITDNATQIRLAQGSLLVRVRHVDDDDSYEIDTPNLALNLLQAGTYRIDVSADGNQTIATVFHGRGRVTGGGYSYNVLAGQSATFTGSDTLNYELGQVPDQDDFDQWALQRDAREDDADSANYVSREMTGYEDLDAAGDWSYVAGYGECWAPRAVAVGWAPYRFGHWVWVGPWGWTWVENEPWGFAPFHYGRWIQVDVGWAWLPGGGGVQATYSPALVAWTGPPGTSGPGQASNAPVGWFPLGPGETYVPAYSASPKYLNMMNATNVNVSYVNVASVNPSQASYMYRSNVTAISHDNFVNGGMVSERTMVPVSPAEVTRSRVSNFAGAAPQKESLLGPGASRQRIAPPPAGVMNRVVVARTAPPPPPVPFNMQERALAAGQGRPIPTADLRRAQPAARPDVFPAPAPGRAPGRESASAVPAPESPRAQVKPVTPLEQQRLDRAATAQAALEKQKEARANAAAAQQAALLKRQQDQAAAIAAQKQALELKREQAAKGAAAAPARPPVVPPRVVPPKPPAVVKPVPPAQ